jgi:hypothetical protein
MKAFGSFFQTIWLVLIVFVVFGWLIRDRFQLAEELAAVSTQNTSLRTQLVQCSGTVGQLEGQLQAAQAVEQQFQQLAEDYSRLQTELAGANERIGQLEQQVAAEQSGRIQVESDFALYKTSCDTVKQSKDNDIRLCREMVVSLGNGQPDQEVSNPTAAPETVLAQAGIGGLLPPLSSNTYVGILVLALALVAGAIGVILEKRPVDLQSSPARPLRARQHSGQPLILRRNVLTPDRRSGSASRE